MPPGKTVLSRFRGRLYWLEQAGKVGDGNNFKIADMRARGHLWTSTQHNAVPGLTLAGEMLRQAAEQHNARLLVVDTLGVANGASEIDRAQVGAFFADWAAWADGNDCAVLLIAHPPKTAGVAYSGSTGILGGVRAMWTIESVRRDCQGDCGSPTELQMRTSLRLSPGERKAELQQGYLSDLAHEPTRRLARKPGPSPRLCGC